MGHYENHMLIGNAAYFNRDNGDALPDRPLVPIEDIRQYVLGLSYEDALEELGCWDEAEITAAYPPEEDYEPEIWAHIETTRGGFETLVIGFQQNFSGEWIATTATL